MNNNHRYFANNSNNKSSSSSNSHNQHHQSRRRHREFDDEVNTSNEAEEQRRLLEEIFGSSYASKTNSSDNNNINNSSKRKSAHPASSSLSPTFSSTSAVSSATSSTKHSSSSRNKSNKLQQSTSPKSMKSAKSHEDRLLARAERDYAMKKKHIINDPSIRDKKSAVRKAMKIFKKSKRQIEAGKKKRFSSLNDVGSDNDSNEDVDDDDEGPYEDSPYLVSPILTAIPLSKNSSISRSKKEDNADDFALPVSSLDNNKEDNEQPQQQLDVLEELVLQLTPTPQECAKRYEAFRDLRNLLKKRLGIYIYVFGSQRTGIALPHSDVDVVARLKPLKKSFSSSSQESGHASDNDASSENSDDDENSSSFGHGNNNNNHHHNGNLRFNRNMTNPSHRNRFANGTASASVTQTRRGKNLPGHFFQTYHAIKGDNRFYEVKPIQHAKVPIIKMRHRQTGVEIDVSFQDDGLDTSKYLTREFDNCFNHFGEPARALVVLLKAYVAGLGLNDPANRGVGSFVCSMLVLWYLKSRRREMEGATTTTRNNNNNGKNNKKKNSNKNPDSTNLPEAEPIKKKHTLREFWIDLLQFYVYDFDAVKFGVDCSSWQAFSKHPSFELTLLNPLEPSRNCASAAALFIPQVRPALEKLYNKIVSHDEEERTRNIKDHITPQRHQQASSKKNHQRNKQNKNDKSDDITDILPNWILFPLIFVTPSELNNNNRSQRRRNNNNHLFFNEDGDSVSSNGGNNSHSHQERENDKAYGGNGIGGYYYNNDDGNSRFLTEKSSGKRVPKTLLWKKRWENIDFLKTHVSNVPSCDAEGFYCALSI